MIMSDEVKMMRQILQYIDVNRIMYFYELVNAYVNDEDKLKFIMKQKNSYFLVNYIKSKDARYKKGRT